MSVVVVLVMLQACLFRRHGKAAGACSEKALVGLCDTSACCCFSTCTQPLSDMTYHTISSQTVKEIGKTSSNHITLRTSFETSPSVTFVRWWSTHVSPVASAGFRHVRDAFRVLKVLFATHRPDWNKADFIRSASSATFEGSPS